MGLWDRNYDNEFTKNLLDGESVYLKHGKPLNSLLLLIYKQQKGPLMERQCQSQLKLVFLVNITF